MWGSVSWSRLGPTTRAPPSLGHSFLRLLGPFHDDISTDREGAKVVRDFCSTAGLSNVGDVRHAVTHSATCSIRDDRAPSAMFLMATGLAITGVASPDATPASSMLSNIAMIWAGTLCTKSPPRDLGCDLKLHHQCVCGRPRRGCLRVSRSRQRHVPRAVRPAGLRAHHFTLSLIFSPVMSAACLARS